MKFYICNHCGNIVYYVRNKGVPIVCCGEKMVELLPGVTDAATEKHVPVVTVEGNKVTANVGSVNHPMTDEHYINWVILETKKGCQKVDLTPTDEPKAVFYVAEGDEPVAVYEYCNLHGLWKADI